MPQMFLDLDLKGRGPSRVVVPQGSWSPHWLGVYTGDRHECTEWPQDWQHVVALVTGRLVVLPRKSYFIAPKDLVLKTFLKNPQPQ